MDVKRLIEQQRQEYEQKRMEALQLAKMNADKALRLEGGLIALDQLMELYAQMGNAVDLSALERVLPEGVDIAGVVVNGEDYPVKAHEADGDNTG